MGNWVNNAEGDWEIITRMPFCYRANSDNCAITLSYDGKLLRRFKFRRGTTVTYSITPAAFGSNDIGMKWEPKDGLYDTEIHGEP